MVGGEPMQYTNKGGKGTARTCINVGQGYGVHPSKKHKFAAQARILVRHIQPFENSKMVENFGG
jgi:hypothetical protein